MTRDALVNGGSYGGAAVSIWAGFTLTEWGIITGIITALVTLAVQLVYHYLKNKREAAEHDLKIERWKKGLHDERKG